MKIALLMLRIIHGGAACSLFTNRHVLFSHPLLPMCKLWMLSEMDQTSKTRPQAACRSMAGGALLVEFWRFRTLLETSAPPPIKAPLTAYGGVEDGGYTVLRKRSNLRRVVVVLSLCWCIHVCRISCMISCTVCGRVLTLHISVI
jgi:hypothetical protein